MRLLATILTLAAVTLTACSTQAQSPKPTTTFSVRAATIKACKEILAFQNGNASDSFQNDPASTQAELDAEDTPLEVDLTNWVDDLQDGAPYQEDANKVGADCGVVGVALFPTG
jgi:hypothetical protein